jgi:outer membrane protein OmpA-like peptidoglycan-associated protein
MKNLNKLFLSILLTTICICLGANSFGFNRAKIEPTGTSFNEYLASRYFAYSDYKAKQEDWRISKYFAKKGAEALKNRTVKPENLEEWKRKFILQNTDFNELEKAENDLYNILSNQKIKKDYPLEAANLQFLYDCWLSEESEYNKYDKISKCKVKFFVLKDYMDSIIISQREKTLEISIQDEYLINKRYIKEGIEYNIYFDFDKFTLNRDANQTIRLLLNFLNTMKGDYMLTLEGHTDRVGKPLYNQSLARKRVLTVKNALKKNGVPNDLIIIDATGKDNPKIITKKGQREKLNRRVSVKITNFNEDFSPIPLPLN